MNPQWKNRGSKLGNHGITGKGNVQSREKSFNTLINERVSIDGKEIVQEEEDKPLAIRECWKEEVGITLKSFSNPHIDVVIKEELEEKIWRFTGFYGAPVEGLRKDSWNLIRHLEKECDLPWVMMGDFNKIMFSFEKKGGCVQDERQMSTFREVLQECDLSNLGFSGQWFTWEKGRLPSNNIREKHDRGMANKKVVEGWRACMGDVPEKLPMLGTNLSRWASKNKASREGRKQGVFSKLNELYEDDPTDEVLAQITNLKIGLNLKADKEEIFWEQRARVNWLKLGNQNTFFFIRL
ncbi:hypothetical protein GOBAR_AA17005 [Gossypium barbadense]|uniref:Endonuclease/exonuclease/phosphatase domain-containing protein n=1 Tax=Gossypium barbadense TaxID=3634 RepID=A0A2P5XK03_GOSBA|nr:hypothetical protein GOBAR_AA17005 [Gossypium barbadense]